MIPDFNIATDLKVEMWLPTEQGSLFIIGISSLGGRDVLAGTGDFMIGSSLLGGTDTLTGESAFGWQALEAVTTQAVIGTGGSIESNFYFQPAAATANLVMQSWAFDPNMNAAVRPGAQIRIRLDDGVVDQVLFNGFVDTIDVAYSSENGAPNTITISAVDAFKTLVNVRIPDFDTTGLPAGYATPNEVIQIVADAAGVVISDDSDELDGKLPTQQVFDEIGATFINDALQVGLGILWVDPATGELIIKKRPAVLGTPPEGTWTVGNNHGDAYHLCMSGITSSSDQDDVVNSLYLYLTSDEATNVTLENADSIDLYGYSSKSQGINTTDATELTRWGNAVFGQAPTRLVTSVTTPAIDRLGDLTAAAGFTPGTIIGVNYDTANIFIDDYYTVIKTVHSIDVNVWNTTLEVWKEF